MITNSGHHTMYTAQGTTSSCESTQNTGLTRSMYRLGRSAKCRRSRASHVPVHRAILSKRETKWSVALLSCDFVFSTHPGDGNQCRHERWIDRRTSSELCCCSHCGSPPRSLCHPSLGCDTGGGGARAHQYQASTVHLQHAAAPATLPRTVEPQGSIGRPNEIVRTILVPIALPDEFSR